MRVKNGISVLFICALLFIISCEGDDGVSPVPIVNRIKKFEVIDTKGILDKYRISVKDPEVYMIATNFYDEKGIKEIKEMYEGMKGTEEYDKFIEEFNATINYYDQLPSGYPQTPTFPLENIEKMNVFFTQLIPLAITYIVNIADNKSDYLLNHSFQKENIEEMKKAITYLFDDTAILKDRINRLSFSLKADAVFNLLNIDTNNVKILFRGEDQPGFFKGFVQTEFVADFIAIQGKEMDDFIKKTPIIVDGFENEQLFFVVLHEMLHTTSFVQDDRYQGGPNDRNTNKYVVDNLIPSQTLNADNYAVLIYIALWNLHKEGLINLSDF